MVSRYIFRAFLRLGYSDLYRAQTDSFVALKLWGCRGDYCGRAKTTHGRDKQSAAPHGDDVALVPAPCVRRHLLVWMAFPPG
jgi:hypothetical protein